MANRNQQQRQQNEPRFKTDHEAMEAVRRAAGTDNNDEAVAAVEDALGGREQ